jgi:hypothetical protein
LTPFTTANEQATAQALCKQFPALTAIKTGSEHARLDMVFTVGNQLRAVAEIKKRKFDLARQHKYGSTLIEWSKYESGVNASLALGVPFVVIVELTDATMFWKVTDSTGSTVVPIERTNKSAQVSEVNKSKILKDCVLLDNKYGREL